MLPSLRLFIPLSEKDTVPGLEVRLLPHQLIGVTWYAHVTISVPFWLI